MLVWLAGCASQPLVPYRVSGDEIREPLTRTPGDPARGHAIALDRGTGACVLCHALPGARFSGNVGPELAGVGSRFSPGQLRLRVVDMARVHPGAAMPAYYRVEGLNQVAEPYRGRPLLTAQQVEDVVAWLATVR